MSEENINKTENDDAKTHFKLSSLPLEDKQNFVDIFAWLIQEDKKQNPEYYQFKINEKVT